MTDVLKMSRKALTVGIVLSTVLWSMMASVLVAPLKASAAGCTSGSLIKGSLPAVYYCGSDGKRYVFTNDKAYKTWYADFSSVMTISDADLASIQIGGNVTYRPGVKMLKIVSDPKTYAIAHGGVLRHVPSEACAVTLYGSAWNTMIDDVSDAFFTNYSVGAAINASCSDYDKNAEMSSSQSINADKNLSTSGVSGTASVSKASDSPAGATLPKGAMGVNFLKFNLSNNGSAMTVDSVTLRRTGPGATTDISAVYLYEGASRLTTGRSVNSSTNEVTFTGLNLSLASGQTRTLWVAVDIATGASAGNVHAMELSKAMSGTTMLSGSPFSGSNFTLAGTTVGSLTIAKTGSITDPKAGEMEAKIAEFTIQAGSSEDVRLERLTLFQGGNLSGGNLTNLKLKQAGLTIATATGFDANLRATFVLSAPGMLLEKGATKTFQVYGDIGGAARAGDNLKLYVEENSDLRGVGQTFGQGTTVTRTAYDGTSCTSSAGQCSYSEVEAGQITLAFLGPSSKDVAENGNDIEVFRFTMVAQSNVEVRNLRTTITASAAGAGSSGLLTTSNVANYTDIKVTNVASGSTWWGPKDVTGTDNGAGDTTQSLDFNDVQTLQAGVVYTFSVTMDVETSALAGQTVTFRKDAWQSSDLRNLDNSTFLSPTADVVPSGALTGNPMTITAASLVASLGSTPTSQSFVKGSAGVDTLGLNLKAGDATAITVTEVSTIGAIDDVPSGAFANGVENTLNVSDVVTSCRLMDGATQLGTSKSPTVATGVMNFTGINLTIAAGQTKSLKVNCDLSNSAPGSERIAFTVVGVTAQDPDGTAVTTTDTALATIDSSNRINGGNGAPPTPTTIITITGTGTMSYTLAPDDTESEAGLVIAGNTVVLAKIRLTAANEELKQTKMRVSLTGANQSSVVSMSLYDGATLVAGPVPLSGQNADFSGFNFVVPKDGSKTLTVKAVLNTISSGAVSGANLQVMTDLSSPDAGTFEYRGTSSSTVVSTIASTDVTGRNKVLRKTKPTVSLAALPTTTLSNGTMVLGRVTITADSAEQVSLKHITWTANKTSATVLTNPTGESAMREVGQGSHIAGDAELTNCGAGQTTCLVASTFDTEQVIAAGTSKTYELVLLVGSAVSNASVSTNIATDSVLITNSLDDVGAGTDVGDSITGDATAFNFIWSDNSAIPHNDTLAGSADWTNGLYVKVLPTDTQTVLFP